MSMTDFDRCEDVRKENGSYVANFMMPGGGVYSKSFDQIHAEIQSRFWETGRFSPAFTKGSHRQLERAYDQLLAMGAKPSPAITEAQKQSWYDAGRCLLPPPPIPLDAGPLLSTGPNALNRPSQGRVVSRTPA